MMEEVYRCYHYRMRSIKRELKQMEEASQEKSRRKEVWRQEEAYQTKHLGKLSYPSLVLSNNCEQNRSFSLTFLHHQI